MFHLRLLVPAELTGRILELLVSYPGVAHVTSVPGGAKLPAGDLVEADVVREATDELIDELIAIGLCDDGAITGEDLVLVRSPEADRAEAESPGQSADSVIWQQVEERSEGEAALSGTYLTFLTIAALLAGIGIVLNSPITIVGAMVVGPEFGPLAALSVGLVRRRWSLVRGGALAIYAGFPIAMLITALLAALAVAAGLFGDRELDLSQQTEFIYEVGPFSLIVALLAGAAGMLSMTSGKSAALVGVFISVTTVPAAGYVSVAAVLGHWPQVGGAALQLAINLFGIVIAAVLTLVIVRRIDVYRAGRRGRRRA
ncbi:DUF389 domain-containing protein [Nakamurella sp. YIM 132087]|uniref:DUF389 domain-containing protein n=1 Tax=Nakamurella alba TaxID=2665158 RepID=A0A7K1FQ42_9ACTN|nr:DUF389 domain-containing protein [Nakamurella alba]MTD16257.1 DUF389 domain-containing protein [Nakamurella alba]